MLVRNVNAWSLCNADYRLLEDVGRAEDVARRHRPMGCRAQLPLPLAGLIQQAERRGVRLLLMPPGVCGI